MARRTRAAQLAASQVGNRALIADHPHFLPMGAFMAGQPASALSGDVGRPTFEQRIRGDRGFCYEMRMPEFGNWYNRWTVNFAIFCPIEPGSPERHADGLHEIPPGSLGMTGNFSLSPSLPKRLRYFVHLTDPFLLSALFVYFSNAVVFLRAPRRPSDPAANWSETCSSLFAFSCLRARSSQP